MSTKENLRNNKASHVRWGILVFLCLLYFITYIDRVNISVAAPSISKEFHFDRVTMGFIFGAFSAAYALGQIPGGWMGDRFGPRRILPTIVTYWSIMTMLTAHAYNFISFMAVRFIFGFGEGGCYPVATRAMQSWYSKADRGFVQGITHSCSRFGAAVVPPISVGIIALWGWRAVFYIFGTVGIVWAMAFYAYYRNTPAEHKHVNAKELAFLREGRGESGNIGDVDASASEKVLHVPWKIILTDRNMLSLCIGFFCYNYNMFFFVTWLPSYLVDYRHLSMATMGWVASLPFLAGTIGDTVGGVVSDWVYRITGNLKLARRIVAAPVMLCSALLIVPAALTDNPYVVVCCLAGACFFLEGVLAVTWAVAMDVSGRYTGTVAGVMNAVGNVAGVLSPIVFGFLAASGSWVAPFILQAGLLILGALIWLFLINPEKSVVERLVPRDAISEHQPFVPPVRAG